MKNGRQFVKKYELFHQPVTLSGTNNKQRISMAKNGEEARLGTPKQRQGWLKILNTARKKFKDENRKITTANFKYTRGHILGHC